MSDLKVPPRLFHYTSQQGLIGILSSKTLWSTRIQYLNDSTEFGYTVELLKNPINARRERGLYLPKVFDVMAKGFDALSKIHIHVACFSEEGDVLSQWRGYGPGGSGGFSIGFTESQLVQAAGRQSCFLAPCIYDVHRQSELVNVLLDDFFAEVAVRAKDERPDYKGMGLDFFFDFVLLACVLKHPSFKEEREWRIVTQDLPDSHTQVAVRQGKFLPIPYFNFALCESKEQLDVEVVVGPTPETNLAMDSVRTLLKVHNCVGSPRSSVVPYREL
jgi:hypothetical protein